MNDHTIFVERANGRWEASFYCRDQDRKYFAYDYDDSAVAVRKLKKLVGLPKHVKVVKA